MYLLFLKDLVFDASHHITKLVIKGDNVDFKLFALFLFKKINSKMV